MDARPLQRRTTMAALVAVCLALGACACRQPASPVAEAAMAPVPGKVTDLTAFERFIAGQPTPEQFRARYPDVQLVLPGTIATKEFRMNHSRYFAELDAEGRIVGGKFQ